MRYWFFAAILTVAATGCRNPDAEFNAEFNRELAATNTSLKELAEKMQPGKVALPPLNEGDEPLELQLLPADPTDEEVAAYAKTIYDQVKERRSSVSGDVFDRLVSRIPPGHITSLAGYLDNFYFRQQLRNWIRPEDKVKILAALPDSPGMLAALSYFPVTAEEIRGPLLQMLKKHPETHPWSMQIYYPVLLDDDATREELTGIVIEHPQLFAIGEAIAEYNDSTDIFTRMWEYAVANDLEIPRQLTSRMMSLGSVEALGKWIQAAWDPERGNERQRKYAVEKAPFLEGQADPAAFFETHKGNIIFNPESKQFECKERAQ